LTQGGCGEFVEIPRSWILLDTCSSNTTSNDARHVKKIKQCDIADEMTTMTNGGPRVFQKEAELKLFPLKAYFDQTSLATVVSYHDMASLQGVRITVDTDVEDVINVTLEQTNSSYKFRPCGAGLYYIDIDAMENHYYELNDSRYEVDAYNLVQSVASNKTFLTNNELKDADKALYYQELLGWPSMSAFRGYVKNNLVTNCKITVDDIVRSEQIYGKAVPELKGKMKRTSPLTHADVKREPLPPPLKGRNLHMFIDVIFVNKIAFFVSKTSDINFITITTLKSRSGKELISAVSDHIDKYEKRGYVSTDIHGDNEFNFPEFERAVRP
jgi:hypothetical protein